jgi:stage II sporulation protein AA (anti-sigma F factor antagonist)
MSYVLNVQMLIKKNVLYARLDGELDQHTVEDLRVRISELIEKYQIRYLVLNFNKLQFMDSSGVGFIIGRYNRLKRIAGGVVLCSMNEHIRKLVLLSGLNKICSIMRSEEEVNEYLGVA